jgi:predicted ATP-dependent serine protease
MDTKETTTCTNCRRQYPKVFSKCPYCKTKNKNK